MSSVFDEDRESLAELAARARDLWEDLDTEAERYGHVNVGVDEEIVAWAFDAGLLTSGEPSGDLARKPRSPGR